MAGTFARAPALMKMRSRREHLVAHANGVRATRTSRDRAITVHRSMPFSHFSMFDRARLDTASARALTRAMSMPTVPSMVTPKSAARRATWAARALATSVLVGMQPVFTHVPPKSLRSTMATVIPAAVRRAASGGPACPVPRMMASKLRLMRATRR